MKSFSMTAGAALMLALPASFAFADHHGGSFKIDRAQAIEIAKTEGMVRVLETDRDDGKWELEGCTADKREIEIDIHGQTGEILSVETDSDYEDDCQ